VAGDIWAGAFDLVMSEYGWTHEHILHHVTPAELLVWSDQIRKRRARMQSDWLALMVTAEAAVHGGQEAWRHYRKVLRQLLEASGDYRPERINGEELAKRLGLMKHERPKRNSETGK